MFVSDRVVSVVNLFYRIYDVRSFHMYQGNFSTMEHSMQGVDDDPTLNVFYSCCSSFEFCASSLFNV